MGKSSRSPKSDQATPSKRCIAIVGPYLSGKTTLLEAILARTGRITRQGKIMEKNTVGDATAEARAHGMSTELTTAETTYLGDHYTFIDCPGSMEFLHEGAAALAVCDAAIVVCEPDPKRLAALQVVLKQLDDRDIPHFLFLNKIDKFQTPVREILPMMQPASDRPFVLRQIPIWEHGIATGFVDLASQRAFVYREHAPSEIISLPDNIKNREHEARFEMLEKLADYDDELMEQLLSDMEPPADKVFDDLSQEFRDGVICPVLLGSAENGNGIVRLLKALRHEAPDVSQTVSRLGLDDAESSAVVIKTIHTSHAGKLSLLRLLTGQLKDGATLTSPTASDRISGLFTMTGQDLAKQADAQPGDTIACGRLDAIKTGETVTATGEAGPEILIDDPPEAVYGMSIEVDERKDDVKMSAALAKLIEEDPSLRLEIEPDSNQMVLWGQGEMQLRVTLEKLERKYAIKVSSKPRQVPYKETIRKSAEARGRHKKQSGGHGQFGDVVIDIKPMPRGTGFKFVDKITGGVVPKQFIPSVKAGVQDYLNRGPMGFGVVDVEVTLKDGSFHSVDSSDMAFRQAGRIAMSEGMPQCQPVLLEAIMSVEIAVPSEATAKVNALISQRRGQILGFDAREGWPGWDVVQSQIPEAEMQDLIIGLRSITAGVGTYRATVDHWSELSGRLADQIVQHRQEAAQ